MGDECVRTLKAGNEAVFDVTDKASRGVLRPDGLQLRHRPEFHASVPRVDHARVSHVNPQWPSSAHNLALWAAETLSSSEVPRQ